MRIAALHDGKRVLFDAVVRMRRDVDGRRSQSSSQMSETRAVFKTGSTRVGGSPKPEKVVTRRFIIFGSDNLAIDISNNDGKSRAVVDLRRNMMVVAQARLVRGSEICIGVQLRAWTRRIRQRGVLLTPPLPRSRIATPLLRGTIISFLKNLGHS